MNAALLVVAPFAIVEFAGLTEALGLDWVASVQRRVIEPPVLVAIALPNELTISTPALKSRQRR